MVGWIVVTTGLLFCAVGVLALLRSLSRLSNENGTIRLVQPADDKDVQPDMWWYTTRRERPTGIYDFPGWPEDED